MTEEKAKELLTKLKQSKAGEEPLSTHEKIEILNWWLKEKSPGIFYDPGDGRQFWLNQIEIKTAQNPQSLFLLDFCMIKIMESLNLSQKTTKRIIKMMNRYVIV